MKSIVVALGVVGLVACVEVPERTDPPSGSDGAVDAASDMQPDPRGDGSMGDRDDAAPPDMASAADMADFDAMLDADLDATTDAMVDAEVDAIIDAEIDAEWLDLGPPGLAEETVLEWSACLPSVEVPAEVGIDDVPCLQVALGSDTPDRVYARAGVALGDGRVLLMGGWAPRSLSPSGLDGGSLIYDPVTDQFARTGGFVPRADFAPAVVDGRIMMFGGLAETDDGTVASTDILTREGLRWQAVSALDAGRVGATAWPDQGGAALVGGYGPGGVFPRLVEGWNRAMEPIDEQIGLGRVHHSMVVAGGQPLIVGGADGSGAALPSAEWRSGDGTWERLDGPAELARAHAAVIHVPTGPLVTGGRSASRDYDGPETPRVFETAIAFQRVEVMDEGDPAFRMVQRPPMSSPRWGHTSSHIGEDDTRVLVVGGAAPVDGSAEVELYVARADTWLTFTLPLLDGARPLERRFHTAVTNSFGWVIVTSGILPDGSLANSNSYFVQTLVFRLVPPMLAGVE